MSIQGRVYSVSQVNGYIKNLLDRDGFWSGLLVQAERSPTTRCTPPGTTTFP